RGHRRKVKRPRGGYGTVVNEILLEPGSERLALAVGSTVPLVFRCYEVDGEGKRHPVVGANLTLEADHPGLVQLKGSDFLVALKGGTTEIWLKDRATGVESNRIVAEALLCAGVDVVGPQEPLRQGQRVRLRIWF